MTCTFLYADDTSPDKTYEVVKRLHEKILMASLGDE
jgi:hypothetical protein